MRVTTASHPARGQDVAALSPSALLWTSAGLMAGLLLIFALDQATEFTPVQHLYYIPIIIASVTFGTRGGLAASLAAIALYHLANPRLLAFEYEHWDVLQVSVFLAVGLTTALLTDDRRRLHLLATTDALTGLHNLRSFEERLAAMVRASREAGTPLALLVIDVDRLKSLNDTYGHLAGAEAVRTVGHIIGAVAPVETVACRYGGDEFVLALQSDTAAARHLADEIAHAVYGTSPVLAGLSFPPQTLSVSVGIACRTFAPGKDAESDTQLGEDLFRAADAALYRAKGHGRNRVYAAS